ncbi:Pentatricopeptide repeat-containing protein [Seminavis robusta]|uniref:Pentatricopeptide repeat-containing protein n=1 Tax=Seminavis robusta TaxID=568900 RepID=A0A9N8ESZ2_9STRA|nr:Pentatricopeptide repeat-containing protein [Seminavis robusta]|eukprot:Sro1683_g290960.1 Pentatricopeptide repeat-containing protein (807) ;mRNA; f:18260-21133
MRISRRVCVFWALLATQELHAFSTVSRTRPLATSAIAPSRKAATLDSVDERIGISLDFSFADTNNVSEGGHSFPDREEFTDILLNEEEYPIGSLPKEVVGSAFEVLFQWGKVGTVEGAEMVERLIERFEKEGDQIVNNRHYTVGVLAWAKVGSFSAAKRAEKLVARMEEIGTSNPFVAPTRTTYSIVARAFAAANKPNRSVKVIHFMEKTPNLLPAFGDYNALLSAYARCGDARGAEDVLKKLVDLCKETGSNEYEPDMHIYHRILDAWAVSNDRFAAKRATQILQALHTQADQGEHSLEPDARTYTAVISAIVRSDDKDRIQQAEALFEQALERGITPDCYLYSAMMQAYANVGAVEKTEEILKVLEEQGIANSVPYNSVIKAWKSSFEPDAAERAEKVLERMVELGIADRISYTTVMAAYAKRGDLDSALRAESLLEQMQELHIQGDKKVKPNLQTYNTVLNCWTKYGDVFRAEKILDQMEDMSRNGQLQSSPNCVSYTTVINGWWRSKKKEAPARAERLFKRMTDSYKAGNKSARPNHISYVNLINAIARSREEEAAQRAEDVLFEMYDQFKEGHTDIKPNGRLVGMVMDSWQKSGSNNAGEKAEALLDWLNSLYEEYQDKDFQPNEFICSSAISAWSKSRCFGKAERARGILEKMKAMHEAGIIASPPNTHCYTAVINSCAYCMDDAAEKSRALSIALGTYKELERTPAHGKANHVTYATVIAALTNLLPPSAERTVANVSVFKRCCATGQVDALVLRRLQGALTAEEMKAVLASGGDGIVTADGTVNLNKIPEAWQHAVDR